MACGALGTNEKLKQENRLCALLGRRQSESKIKLSLCLLTEHYAMKTY
jgi:hypothetical protein